MEERGGGLIRRSAVCRSPRLIRNRLRQRRGTMRYRVDDHKGKLAAVEVEDLDWDAFRDQPLDQDALRCIAYMHDVEHHTICYLRDVLVTDAHRDHEITSFLTFWAFEEYFHGEALGRVLEAHGEAGSAVRVPAARRRGELGLGLGVRVRVRVRV